MSIAALDLNLLHLLDTVLAERSVVRAARRLHVTPSAVSNALARLRTALDDPLLIRSGRGVVPTPRAAALAPALTRALRDLDQAIHGDAFDLATTDRELTLAIADAGQVVKLPRIVAALARRMPRARLRVVSIDTLFASGGLAGTEIDVAIGGRRAVARDDVTRAIEGDGRERLARLEHARHGVAQRARARLRFGLRGRGREARRQQEGVLLARRHAQLLGEAKHHDAARV